MNTTEENPSHLDFMHELLDDVEGELEDEVCGPSSALYGMG